MVYAKTLKACGPKPRKKPVMKVSEKPSKKEKPTQEDSVSKRGDRLIMAGSMEAGIGFMT